MNKYYIREKCTRPMVVSLGFFDCVHLGHQLIIEETAAMAEKLGAETAITTFANDPNALLNKKPQIYTMLEREHVFQNLGIENILFSYFNETFVQTSARTALDVLTENFNVVGVVAGRDFTFGYKAEGNVDFLKEYMQEKDIKVKIIPFEKFAEQKLSATMLKKLVLSGRVCTVNTCLSQPYFLMGTIIHGRNRGAMLGYPTANISIHPDCLKLGQGIYATKIYFDGRAHVGVTNVGAKPTFGERDYTIETHIPNFNGNIYGKDVKLEFYQFIRPPIKFSSVPELKEQLGKDIAEVLDYFA